MLTSAIPLERSRRKLSIEVAEHGSTPSIGLLLKPREFRAYSRWNYILAVDTQYKYVYIGVVLVVCFRFVVMFSWAPRYTLLLETRQLPLGI